MHVNTIENQFLSFNIYSGEILSKSDKDPFAEIKIGAPVVIAGYYYVGEIGEEIPVLIKWKTHIVSEINGDKLLLG